MNWRDMTAADIEDYNAKVARDAQAALKASKTRISMLPTNERMALAEASKVKPVRKLNEEWPRKAIICGVLPSSSHFEPKNVNLPHEDHLDPEIPNAKQRKRKAPLAGGGEGEAQSPGCPHVRFTLCRVRLLDVDAKVHSCKDLIDGLAICGIIRGDKEGQITLEVNQIRVSSFKDEKTVIEIEFP